MFRIFYGNTSSTRKAAKVDIVRGFVIRRFFFLLLHNCKRIKMGIDSRPSQNYESILSEITFCIPLYWGLIFVYIAYHQFFYFTC